MNFVSSLLIIAFISVITFVIAAEGHESPNLEEEVMQLKAMMQEQHELVKELQLRITKKENEQKSNGQAFDCYRTEDWTTEGIITFNGCSVDTTTIDPWKGTFTIQDAGLYRFTFEGLVLLPSDSVNPYGLVQLYVDDKVVASGYVEENTDDINLNNRDFMISIDTLQLLEVGQTVSIQWDCRSNEVLIGNNNTYLHFTGHNLATSALVPPQRIEAKLEQFESVLLEQQQKIQNQDKTIKELQQKIATNENAQKSNGQVFDCYRIEDWTTQGIITFNGCSVDTTTIDPWKGTFIIKDSGLYRITFEGSAVIPHASDYPYGIVSLHVEDKVVASGYVEEQDSGGIASDYGIFMVSIDTIQALEVGQNVSITWSGTGGLYSDPSIPIHFTGHNLASSTLVPPQCEYTGQTFEYPGSCRKYYLCRADGTIELNDCCPGVFDPVGESCIPDEDGSYLCNDVDTC